MSERYCRKCGNVTNKHLLVDGDERIVREITPEIAGGPVEIKWPERTENARVCVEFHGRGNNAERVESYFVPTHYCCSCDELIPEPLTRTNPLTASEAARWWDV